VNPGAPNTTHCRRTTIFPAKVVWPENESSSIRYNLLILQILFLVSIFESEERASINQKQNTVTIQCGAEASSSSKTE